MYCLAQCTASQTDRRTDGQTDGQIFMPIADNDCMQYG